MRLLARELTLSSRRSGLWIAAAVHAVLAFTFLQAWEGVRTVPGLPGASLSEQLGLLQQALAVVAAPWIAARIAAPERRADLPRLAHLFGVSETALAQARFGVTAIWILLFCAAALPIAVIAHEMAVAPASLLGGQLRLLLVALAAGGLGVAIARRLDGDIRRWLIATALAGTAWLALAWRLA